MNDPDRRTFLAGALGATVLALEPELLAAPLRLEQPLRAGLVGAGRQGRALLAELSKIEDVSVTCLCDVDPSRLQSGLRRVAGAEGVDEPARLIERADVDCVLVATPTHLHRDVAVQALEAGKHVYCEAPLAHTVEDAHAIARAARSARGVFQTGMQARANPVYALARSFVRSGAIRDVIALRGQFHRKTDWRSPSSDPAREKALNWKLDPEVSLGLVGELGVHQLDVMHWFLGSYPASVRGRGDVLAWKDGRKVADTIQCTFDFPGQVQMSYEATLGNSLGGTEELLLGTMGAVRLAWNAGWLFKEADAPTQGWEVYANRERFHNDEGVTLIADATKLAAQGKLEEGVGLPHPPLYYALEAFVQSVGEGAEVVCSADEGVRATAVVVAAARALATGETVAISTEDR